MGAVAWPRWALWPVLWRRPQKRPSHSHQPIALHRSLGWPAEELRSAGTGQPSLPYVRLRSAPLPASFALPPPRHIARLLALPRSALRPSSPPCPRLATPAAEVVRAVRDDVPEVPPRARGPREGEARTRRGAGRAGGSLGELGGSPGRAGSETSCRCRSRAPGAVAWPGRRGGDGWQHDVLKPGSFTRGSTKKLP